MSAREIPMQPSENQVLGPKLTYDPSWTGPLNVKRSTTNPWMLIPFILVFLNWIGVTCYAFANGDLNNDIWSHARRTLRSERWIIVGTWIFAVFLTLIFFAFLRIATKLTIYALNLLFLIVAILSACWYIQSINKKGTNYHRIIALAALIIMLIIILRSSFVNRRFIPKASEIIPETIKALIYFPSLILYLLPLYALALVTTALSVAVSACLLRIDQKFETLFGLYCHLSNFLGCIWLTLVYFAFYRVAISGTYGTWYWSRDKQEVPKFTPMRFIWITLRYHLGSVIVGSFLTHIGKIIATMGLSHATYAEPIIDGRNEYMQVEKFYQRCYNYTGRISDLVYVYTALRGQGYCESAKNSFQIWRRNHTKFAAIDQFIRELIFMGFITISSLSMVVYAGLKFTVCATTSLTAQLFVFFFIYFAINSILLLLEVAMDTILICGLEDFEVNGNSARPYYMSDKLKKIILENRME